MGQFMTDYRKLKPGSRAILKNLINTLVYIQKTAPAGKRAEENDRFVITRHSKR
jgi:hypothetical protein